MHLLPATLTAASLLSLALDVSAAPHPAPSTGSSAHMTLMRRSKGRRDLAKRSSDDVAASLKRRKLSVEAKYGIGHAKNQKRSSGMNLITDQNADSSYFGSLAIGTPAVSFDVILDTGSSDLWVAGTMSSNTTSDIPSGITTFDSSASSTFTSLDKTFEITYDSGDAEGELAEDTIQMAGFEVTAQTFAVVNEVSSGVLTSPVSGLMGLAWEEIASSGATPFWQTLASSNGTLTDALFGVQLTRYNNASDVQSLEPGGTFTLGAANTSLYTGDIDYQDIPSGEVGYWIQEVAGITVNSDSVTLSSDSYAAIDTGTTLVGGPSDVIAEIYAKIDGSEAGTGDLDGYYTYPCSTSVEVAMTFGSSSNSWSISPDDFEFETVDNGDTCIGAFFVVDNSGTTAPAWIVGDTFLKNVYSVFKYDPPAVGFAKLSETALAMNGVKAAAPSATIGSVAAAVSATAAIDNTSAAAPSMRLQGGAAFTLLSFAAASVVGAFLL